MYRLTTNKLSLSLVDLFDPSAAIGNSIGHTYRVRPLNPVLRPWKRASSVELLLVGMDWAHVSLYTSFS